MILQFLTLTPGGALGNFTTSSITFVDISSALNLSFHSNGGLWIFLLQARAYETTLGAGIPIINLTFNLDGTEINPRGGNGLISQEFANNGVNIPLIMMWIQKVTRGVHTIKPQWLVDAGTTTGTIFNDTTNNYIKLYAIELDF